MGIKKPTRFSDKFKGTWGELDSAELYDKINLVVEQERITKNPLAETGAKHLESNFYVLVACQM